MPLSNYGNINSSRKTIMILNLTIYNQLLALLWIFLLYVGFELRKLCLRSNLLRFPRISINNLPSSTT